jgi:hypothetical protein
MEPLLQAMHMTYREHATDWWSRIEQPCRRALQPAKAITRRVRLQSKLRAAVARS